MSKGLDFQRMEKKIHCIKEFLGVIPGFVKNTGFNEDPPKIRMFLMLKCRIYENSTSLQCEEAEPINSSSLHPMLISVGLWLVFLNLQTDRYPWTLFVFFLRKARSLCETSMSPTSAVHQTSSDKKLGWQSLNLRTSSWRRISDATVAGEQALGVWQTTQEG